MNVWVLVLFYVTRIGSVASSQVSPLTEKGCKEQAIAYNMNQKIPIIAFCVEKR